VSPEEDDPKLTVEACDLADVPSVVWDALLAPGRRVQCYGLLEAASTVELEGFALRVIVARRSGEIVAAAPAYPYRLDLTLFANRRTRRAVSALRRLLPGLLKLAVFELGWPAITAEPIVGEASPSVLRAMSELAIAEAHRRGARLVVVRDFRADDAVARRSLGPIGFDAVPTPSDFVLDVQDFDSLGDYFAAMRSNYRRRALQRLTRGKAVRLDHVTNLAPLAREMADLNRAVHARAKELRREVLGHAFFAALARVPMTSALVMRHDDGSLERFALLYDDRPILRPIFYGGPPDAARDHAYLKMLGGVVRIGIEGGFSAIDLGVTTGEPKLNLGARPEPLCAWMLHRSRSIHGAFIRLMRGPLAPKEAGRRRVFRSASPANT